MANEFQASKCECRIQCGHPRVLVCVSAPAFASNRRVKVMFLLQGDDADGVEEGKRRKPTQPTTPSQLCTKDEGT